MRYLILVPFILLFLAAIIGPVVLFVLQHMKLEAMRRRPSQPAAERLGWGGGDF